MADKLAQLIDLVIENDELPSSIWLVELSDLDQAEIDFLNENWENIPADKRKHLLETIGKLGDEDFMLAFEAFNRFAIMDSAADVRLQAIRNLWESEDYHLIPILISSLINDPSLEVRAAAAKALGSFVLNGEMDSYPPQFSVDLEKALLNTLQIEEDSAIRCRCIESLGYSTHDDVNQLILNAYNSEDEDLIQAALLAMGRSADEQWAELVTAHFHSPSPTLRYESVVAAGEIEIREAVPDLIELIDDIEVTIRNAAIWSLSQIGGTLASDALNSLMEDAEDKDLDPENLQDALDNLEFVNSTRNLVLYDSEEAQDSSS